ncbi:MAG TPA: GTPase Era [Clostridiales bacterium]|nr:MAG: GTPase Era [Clostridiales bacterium GWD2_32_59]HAN09469.1 GTPase Era [Clostridiales bacterium]
MADKFKSGFITIIGRPNVGKSTLMNYVVGEKISIISNKPQTTRNKITAVHTTDECQMIFIDTPGIHKPKNKLGEYMMQAVNSNLNEVDVVLFLIDAGDDRDREEMIAHIKGIQSTVILVINKIDTVKKEELLSLIYKYKELYPFKEVVPISAIKGENVDALLDVIKNYLEEGPKYFPDDMLTDQPERQIISEIIREKALQLLDKEIPHGIAIGIEKMKKRDNKDLIDISATIYCEKKSHKAIIIGKDGIMLKKIGMYARQDMERILGSKIYLELWIKIKDNWRENEFLLKNFGYDIKNK